MAIPEYGLADTVVHPPGHEPCAALARDLSRPLGLRPQPLSYVSAPDAALVVAPPADRRRAAGAPVLVVPRRARHRPRLEGASVVCGVQDVDDAPAAAIAGAMAEGLGVRLLLTHVVAPVAIAVPGPAAAPVLCDRAEEGRRNGRRTLEQVAIAAGLEGVDGEQRLARGAPGPVLADLARAEDAALIVVSRTSRSWLVRGLLGSAASHLVRRADRPVLVCPRDPLAAMRLREAVESAGCGT